jgi:hypothetical protein
LVNIRELLGNFAYMGHDWDLNWDLFGKFEALGRVWEYSTSWELFGSVKEPSGTCLGGPEFGKS